MAELHLGFQDGTYFLWSGKEVDDSREPVILAPEESAVAYFADVLRRILERDGPAYSRHNQANVYVEVKPGDKFVAPEGTVSAPSPAPAASLRTARSKVEMSELAGIRHAENGWTLEIAERLFVYEFSDHDETSERRAFARLLRQLAEALGPPTTRYSPERIQVVVRPGDKFGEALTHRAAVADLAGDQADEESEC